MLFLVGFTTGIELELLVITRVLTKDHRYRYSSLIFLDANSLIGAFSCLDFLTSGTWLRLSPCLSVSGSFAVIFWFSLKTQLTVESHFNSLFAAVIVIQHLHNMKIVEMLYSCVLNFFFSFVHNCMFKLKLNWMSDPHSWNLDFPLVILIDTLICIFICTPTDHFTFRLVACLDFIALCPSCYCLWSHFQLKLNIFIIYNEWSHLICLSQSHQVEWSFPFPDPALQCAPTVFFSDTGR